MLAVLCGMIYPLTGLGVLFTGLRFINVKQREYTSDDALSNHYKQ